MVHAKERPELVQWRHACNNVVATAQQTGSLFQDFLLLGGPDAIRSLQQTVRMLQTQLEDTKQDGKLERYRLLQKDLQELDKVNSALRQLLKADKGLTDEQVDEHVKQKMFKASLLYGASRELLMKENRILRAQLEQHLVTTRTSHAVGKLSPSASPGVISKSKAKQAQMMQAPHMEAVSQLLRSAEELAEAERNYQLPGMRHVEVEADDGSRKYIHTLEQQVTTLAGQKVNLMNQVADLRQQVHVLDMKLDAANDQLVEFRRWKTEMLAHQENLSADLRAHLQSEAKRADTAEIALAETGEALRHAQQQMEAQKEQLARALSELQATQTALQEKTEQVNTLSGLLLELREALSALAGDVARGQEEFGQRLMGAMHDAHEEHQQLIKGVGSMAMNAQQAAQHGADGVTGLSAQQRQLMDEVMEHRHASTVTLKAYEKQLTVMQRLLQHAELERIRMARQVVAASALSRIEDRRHERTVNMLLTELPHSMAGELAPQFEAIEHNTKVVAEQLELNNQHLGTSPPRRDTGAGAPGSGLPGPWDLEDDDTSRVLDASRALRAQLHGLTSAQALTSLGPWPTLPHGGGAEASGFSMSTTGLAPLMPRFVQQGLDMAPAPVPPLVEALGSALRASGAHTSPRPPPMPMGPMPPTALAPAHTVWLPISQGGAAPLLPGPGGTAGTAMPVAHPTQAAEPPQALPFQAADAAAVPAARLLASETAPPAATAPAVAGFGSVPAVSAAAVLDVPQQQQHIPSAPAEAGRQSASSMQPPRGAPADAAALQRTASSRTPKAAEAAEGRPVAAGFASAASTMPRSPPPGPAVPGTATTGPGHEPQQAAVGSHVAEESADLPASTTSAAALGMGAGALPAVKGMAPGSPAPPGGELPPAVASDQPPAHVWTPGPALLNSTFGKRMTSGGGAVMQPAPVPTVAVPAAMPMGTMATADKLPQQSAGATVPSTPAQYAASNVPSPARQQPVVMQQLMAGAGDARVNLDASRPQFESSGALPEVPTIGTHVSQLSAVPMLGAAQPGAVASRQLTGSTLSMRVGAPEMTLMMTPVAMRPAALPSFNPTPAHHAYDAYDDLPVGRPPTTAAASGAYRQAAQLTPTGDAVELWDAQGGPDDWEDMPQAPTEMSAALRPPSTTASQVFGRSMLPMQQASHAPQMPALTVHGGLPYSTSQRWAASMPTAYAGEHGAATGATQPWGDDSVPVNWPEMPSATLGGHTQHGMQAQAASQAPSNVQLLPPGPPIAEQWSVPQA